MIIKDRVSSEFSHNSRLKGTRYFHQGKIVPAIVDAQFFAGIVLGSQEYLVSIELILEDDRSCLVYVSCTCPHFKDGNYCKHLWSALLYCEARASFLVPGDCASLELVRDIDASTKQANITVTKKQSGIQADIEKIRDYLDMQPADVDFDVDNMKRNKMADIEFRYEIHTRDWADPDVYVRPAMRERRKNGEWGVWKKLPLSLNLNDLSEQDFLLVSSLRDLNERSGYYADSYKSPSDSGVLKILPSICKTGCAFFALDEGDKKNMAGPCEWVQGEPWRAIIRVAHAENEAENSCTCVLVRDDVCLDLDELLYVSKNGIIFYGNNVSVLRDKEHAGWVRYFKDNGALTFSDPDVNSVLQNIGQMPNLPEIELPENWSDKIQRVRPVPVLRIPRIPAGERSFFATLNFDYQGVEIAADSKVSFVSSDSPHWSCRRDKETEQAYWTMLRSYGASRVSSFFSRDGNCNIPSKDFSLLLEEAVKSGWRIYIKNQAYRKAGGFSTSVKSGIDWLELHVQCEYDGASVDLPKLLRAVKEKKQWVELSDGSIGTIPEEWLNRYAGVISMGTVEGDSIRFQNCQAALLDVWLRELPDVQVDQAFAGLQKKLKEAGCIQPAKKPVGFKGMLRDYQKDGLGWLIYLQTIQAGGCLADDMGLGKTVQALAVLQKNKQAALRKKKSANPPSLVVAPRSLIFNWIREAAQFAPSLKILNHTGAARATEKPELLDCDIVITTYGTMRQDIGLLKNIHFHYVILDEAQMIKNAAAQTAKASRLLQGDHRLALSGTPIENHLGELWSLFEFLNPGFLGGRDNFNRRWVKSENIEQRALLSNALRPFILRRTKQQVAKDLPERQEETLFCEMPPAQKKEYDEMLQYYRINMLTNVKKKGMNKSKMMIIEALLRLRQIACHPGLLDEKHSRMSTAKFEMLMPMIEELAEENNKALIFSQFTSYLSFLKSELDARGIVYEYLDGRTQKRDEKVDRFQNDEQCPLFLISLKAGGLGLNLTAAEYVFILDPWWNPAVEAQAIDRTHRIGQTKKVIAYRLITQDTVENKIMQLQQHKKALTESIINDNNALLKNLDYEDLAYLFDANQE